MDNASGFPLSAAEDGTAIKAAMRGAASEPAEYGVVGIAASLGGIAALSFVLESLEAEFPLPILVVQHLRRGHPSFLAKILGRHTILPVKRAEEGELPRPGRVYVAPPDRHLIVRPDGTIGLFRGEAVNFCRPSADVLFRSLAETFGPRTIGIVLTGLGHDGARGLEAIAQAGGATLAQDDSTAVAASMPQAAVDIGHAELVLSLDRIGFALTVLATASLSGGGVHVARSPSASLQA